MNHSPIKSAAATDVAVSAASAYYSGRESPDQAGTTRALCCPGSFVDGSGSEDLSRGASAGNNQTGGKLNMQEVNFEEVLEQILAKDKRYHRDAYNFVREALDFTQKLIVKENKGELRHVTGQELLDGIRQYALSLFGPMVTTVFEEWGVRNCRDFGEIVFNMVESGLLAKTENDSRKDFDGGYDFRDAFRKPFLPSGKSGADQPVVKPSKA
jgi:uncharacterized repeat protein (TIGR04138 family)